MTYDPTAVERLKASLRLEEVAARYIHLARKGRSYTGLCPFHDDHSPSFSIDAGRQLFRCFACGEQGDVIAFIQRIENCTFAEALARLGADGGAAVAAHPTASRADKSLSARSVPPAPSPEANEAFLKSLLPYASGVSALSPAYLDFEVGQAPALLPAPWRAMQGRIIFPIRNEAGELVAFAGRRAEDAASANEPKYINSATSARYKKGETLYALHRAAEWIRQEESVFIVEGYKDALAMHAAGFRNTVALCGTALTDAHITLLRKYTDRIYLLLDGDEAGRRAAQKGMDRLLAEGLEVDSLPLPAGEDPDSLFRRLGCEAFVAHIRAGLLIPSPSECLLLTACLLYPETEYQDARQTCRFTELLAVVLSTDEIPFESPVHREILSHLVAGGTEETLPCPLREIAMQLHTDYDAPIRQDLAGREGSAADFLLRLTFSYSEIRLVRAIRRQMRKLNRVSSASVQWLEGLENRRQQLEQVSLWLKRPGMMGEGWIR